MLGRFQATWEGAQLTHFETAPRLRALLQHLVLASGTSISRAELAAELWPEVRDSQSRANLRQALARLWRALPDATRFVRTSPASVGWLADAPAFVDVHAFHEAVAAATAAHDRGDHDGHQRALTAAARLYQGDLVLDVPSERLERVRSNLLEAVTRTLADLAALHAAAGENRQAIGYLERLLELDPLDEAAHRKLMALHAEVGDRARALRVFERLRTTLQREVDDIPSNATVQIVERLRSGVGHGHALPLTGRRGELTRLVTALERARADGPTLVLVRGEPGIGKTALLNTVATRLAGRGETVLVAQVASVDTLVPYGAAARLLGATRLLAASRRLRAPLNLELRRLAGEPLALDRAAATPRTGEDRSASAADAARLRAALHGALADDAPDVALILDDAHHLDRESAAWLADLVAASRGSRTPYAVIAAARSEDADASPLATLRQRAAERGRLLPLELGPLAPEDVAGLAAAVRGHVLPAAEAELLSHRTRGNPLFIVELLASEAGNEGVPETRVPQRLEALLDARLQRLPPTAADALEGLAVLGADGTTELLAHLLERPATEVAGDLDELWRRRLIDVTEDAGPVAHPLVREVAYGRLAPARRALLHARAADALSRRQRRDGTPDAVIAHHLERAGRPAEAAAALARAAERAASVAANDEAIAAYRHAIHLLARGRATPDPTLAALWQGLGDVHARRLDGPAARDAYREAARLTAGDAIAAAALAQRIATTHADERANQEALDQLATAEALLRSSRRRSGRWWRTAIDVDELRTRVMYLLPEVDPTDVAAVLARLDAAVERHGTLAQRLERDYAQLRFDMRRERYRLSAATVAHTERATRTAAATGHATAMAEAAFAMGFATLFGGHADRAIHDLLEARRLAAGCGARLFLVQSIAYLSLAHRLADRHADAAALQDELDAHVDTATPLYLGLAHAQRGWLAYRDGRLAAARASCESALAAWAGRWYPFEWTALLPLVALANDGPSARAAAEAMLRDDQQLLPDRLMTTLRALTRSRRGWAARRDAVVAVARDLRHL